MNADTLVSILLEDDSLDSLESVPDWASTYEKGSPGWRERQLRYWKPRTPKEAEELGVDWYVKDHRKVPVKREYAASAPMARHSVTLATNRNAKRASYGYTDLYSIRDRGWPTREPKTKAAQARQRQKQRDAAWERQFAEEDRIKGDGI